ncbi:MULTISPECIES: alpha-amylase [Chitinophaga]|uniref:alpha-amylase n=1 Tax=Chitinophaga TaxID=79328 RepID=UPI000BB06CA9|nr:MULTISPECIES: alpha-amylase [Chitinophaga]ASZ10258.1 alpha-amylase [Chitinophaga sp. MD30]
MNQTIFQFFHWYTTAGGTWWQHFQEIVPQLKEQGITHVWLPPAYKGSKGPTSEGYDVYDLYDLGEFDQKGSVATKYGDRDTYLSAVRYAQEQQLKVLPDIVLNHKLGGDAEESFAVLRIDPENRTNVIGDPFQINGFTHFTFPGRAGKYSSFEWNFQSFSGVDYAANLPPEEQGIFKILNDYGEEWSKAVDDEKGNFDYLMGADVEFRNPYVQEELIKWGLWYYDTVHPDGFRLDAVKHMSWKYYKKWIAAMRAHADKELFIVGEYWTADNIEAMLRYMQQTEESMYLFDTILHHHFHLASCGEYDLRQLYDNTFTAHYPQYSVTFVDNHDTQPLQSLESPVQPWFKPIAYALILLREQGIPCIFYPDWYGASYRDKDQDIELPAVGELSVLQIARQKYAYGEQEDHFVSGDLIGWVRKGDPAHPLTGCVVIISNHEGGHIHMQYPHFSGKTFINCLNDTQVIQLSEDGGADFYVSGKGVAVWIPVEAHE